MYSKISFRLNIAIWIISQIVIILKFDVVARCFYLYRYNERLGCFLIQVAFVGEEEIYD